LNGTVISLLQFELTIRSQMFKTLRLCSMGLKLSAPYFVASREGPNHSHRQPKSNHNGFRSHCRRIATRTGRHDQLIAMEKENSEGRSAVLSRKMSKKKKPKQRFRRRSTRNDRSSFGPLQGKDLPSTNEDNLKTSKYMIESTVATSDSDSVKSSKAFHQSGNIRNSMSAGVLEREGENVEANVFEADVSIIASVGSDRDHDLLQDDSSARHGSWQSLSSSNQVASVDCGSNEFPETRLNAHAPEFYPETLTHHLDESFPVSGRPHPRPSSLVHDPYSYTGASMPPSHVAMDAFSCLPHHQHARFAEVSVETQMVPRRTLSSRFASWRSATNRTAPEDKIHFPLPQSAGPKIFSWNGKRVTLVDNAKKIIVIDLAPRHVCDMIVQMTEDHIARAETNQDLETWRTLYTYTKMDLPCCEVEGVPRLTNALTSMVKGILGELCGTPSAAENLEPRSWKEPHLLRYQIVEGKPIHTGVELHYDGRCVYVCIALCCWQEIELLTSFSSFHIAQILYLAFFSHFTWQLMLSDQDEYDGESRYSLRSNDAQNYIYISSHSFSLSRM
jgi:hypothetical protein